MASPLTLECSKCRKKLSKTDSKRCSNCKLTYYCSVKCREIIGNLIKQFVKRGLI